MPARGPRRRRGCHRKLGRMPPRPPAAPATAFARRPASGRARSPCRPPRADAPAASRARLPR
eukprot:7855504-Pyramimonas_sp.AAC.1